MDASKLRDLRTLVEALRGVVLDWDSIVASVETLTRDNEQLRSGADGQGREHRALREAYERLRREREETDRAGAELAAGRETLLREQRAVHEQREGYETLVREHAEATSALRQLRQQYDALAQSRAHGGASADGAAPAHGTGPLLAELARQQAGIHGLFRVSELALQDLTPSSLAEMVLSDAMRSLRSDAALMLLCDRDGNFTESQEGKPALVAQLHNFLDSSFKELVKTGGKETITLTGKVHPFSAVAALIPNTGNSIGVLCLGREADSGPYLSDEKQFLVVYARNVALGLQNIVVRGNLEANIIDTMSFFVTALESRDPYLKGHSARVSLYAGEIATVMRLPHAQVAVARRTGLLHDLGKLMLPDAIRLKDKPLAKEEYALLMRHPMVADRMLRPLRFLTFEASAVRHHLERHDGTGYPDGLRGEEIPLPARVVAVADCFDAMLSNRPYRDALPIDVAMNEVLRGAGTQFDPAVIEAFGSIPRARLAEIGGYYNTTPGTVSSPPAEAPADAGLAIAPEPPVAVQA
jgi:HD-GYP domain-containing protein (c-di-GMP phosphodiesterase class II)